MTIPAVIATWKFGGPAVEKTGSLLLEGMDLLAAVERGINVVELDPGVNSVGYGGKPNSCGVVEADAAIMDGRTCKVGCVAGLKHCRRPISVALRVLEKSPHSMLAGEGACEFAREQGFPHEEMLTPASEEKFNEWKAGGRGAPEASHDTIGLAAVDCKGNTAAGCSTSGLAFKQPGRVGDSPIIGSGLYADNEVGAAAATGNGDEILKFCISFLVIQFKIMFAF